MRTFKIGPPTDWNNIANGEVLTFETSGNSRNIKLSLNTSHQTSVYALIDNIPRLLGASQGLFDLEFVVSSATEVMFMSLDDADIFVKGHAPSHRVAGRDLPSLTSIEPGVRRNTQFDRMMYVMQQNEANRQAQYNAMIARAAEREAQQAEKEAKRVAAKDLDPKDPKVPEADPVHQDKKDE